jgi:hypothetical protein
MPRSALRRNGTALEGKIKLGEASQIPPSCEGPKFAWVVVGESSCSLRVLLYRERTRGRVEPGDSSTPDCGGGPDIVSRSNDCDIEARSWRSFSVQRRVLGIVPIVMIVIGAVIVIATLSGTSRTNFQAWSYAGAFTEFAAAIGMLIGYRFMFKTASDRAAESAARQCLQGGLCFLGVSIYWNIRSFLAFPPHASMGNAIEFSVLTLMTILFMGWLDTVCLRLRRLRALRRANRQPSH